MMKAIVVHQFGDPEAMRYEEVPDLKAEAGQILVRISAIGVNPVDTYIRSGKYNRLPSLPYIPGMDAAGTIESVGEEIKIAPGSRVYCSGTITGAYAEYALCSREQVHRLPDK